MSDKQFTKKDEPEPFTNPEEDIAEAETILPHRPPQITRPLETAKLKTPERTVDVLSNDGDTAQFAWSHAPNEKFSVNRAKTGLSKDAFSKHFRAGMRGVEPPPED